MPGKSTKAKKPTAFVGFTYGGPFKQGIVQLFKYSIPFDDAQAELKVRFGDGVVGRYALAADVDECFDKICKQCEEFRIAEHIFKINVTPMANIIKEVVEAKTLSHFGPEKDDSDDEKKEKKVSKKPTKKSDDDEKPSKKSKKGKDSDSDSGSDDEDEKPTKKPVKKEDKPKKDEKSKKDEKPAKKGGKKDSPKKDDSDAESEADDSD